MSTAIRDDSLRGPDGSRQAPIRHVRCPFHFVRREFSPGADRPFVPATVATPAE